MSNLHDVRRDYQGDVLDQEVLRSDPMGATEAWLQKLCRSSAENAIFLATSDQEGQPHGRVVLIKAISSEGLHFYELFSAKGRELAMNPKPR